VHALSSTPRPTRRPLLRSLGLTATAVVLTVSLAACGDDVAEEAVSSTGTSAGAATADAGAATSQGAVVVGDPWVRATQGTEDPSMTGAFMTLDNPGTEAVTLVSASSSVAGMTELHEMVMVDGAMAMQAVDGGIVLEAGRGKVLEPGGFHVMLMGLRDALAPGDEVDLSLTFSDGSTQDLTVPVKAFTEEEGHYHAPGTGDHDH
jgi:periplasmic copper chaperone A